MCLGSALPAHADRDASNVTIAEMVIGTSTQNVLFIRASTTPTGTTGCHQNAHWHYTLLLDSAVGKNMYALLLSMVATGQPIALAGAGACNEYSPLNNGVESLRAVGVVF